VTTPGLMKDTPSSEGVWTSMHLGIYIILLFEIAHIDFHGVMWDRSEWKTTFSWMEFFYKKITYCYTKATSS
jgi:hypothetical protein